MMMPSRAPCHPEGVLRPKDLGLVTRVSTPRSLGRLGSLGMTIAVVLLLVTAAPAAEVWHFKREFLPALVKAVPKILESQDKQTGRFGTGIWIVQDQHPMYPLAVAWATRIDGVENPYYHNTEVLEAIMSAGDALIADQDEKGMWEFRKKDSSTWGKIYMPWTYSRWIRTFDLIKEGMPSDRRAKWEKG